MIERAFLRRAAAAGAVILGLALAGCGPGGATLERVRAAGELRIGVRSDSPPFGFKDEAGNPRGFDVDLGFRLAKVLGVRPDFVFVTPKERFTKLQSGEIDCVIATLTANRRRARELDFSIPYFQDQQQLLVKADSPIQSYRDLPAKKVAAAEGTTSLENLTTISPDCQPVKVADLEEGFQLLREGKVDALISDGVKLIARRLDDPHPDAFRLAGAAPSVELYVIGLPRDDSEFRRAVDEFLMDLWNSGHWTRLFDKWLGGRSRYKLAPAFQMPVLPP